MSRCLTTVLLLLLALTTKSHASTFTGELFSADYYRWFYRWHRGGAWVAHQERHPCFGTNTLCKFIQRNNTQEPKLKLSVNTTLAKQLAVVEVSFADIAIAMDDLLAVYLVDPEEIQYVDGDPLSDFVDYVDANESRVTGSDLHSVVFGPLVNVRASYQFKYLRKLQNEQEEGRPVFTVLGESPFVEMERGHTEPLQVRLSLTGKKNEMRVTWVTGQVFGASVGFGTAASRVLERRAEATTETYDALDMCNAPATIRSSVHFRHPGYLHDAVMTDLVPGERYIYRVGSATGVSSPELQFTFPAALDRTTESQRPQGFFVFGDLGTGVLEKPTEELDFDETNPERHFSGLDMVSRLAKWGDERTVMERIRQDLDDSLQDNADADTPEYAALIHIGDISYAKGRTYVWDQFGAVVQPVASRLPYMVGIGNHEYDYIVNGEGHDLSGSEAALSNGWHPDGANFGEDSHGECGVPYAYRFHMPEAMDPSAKPPFWYSFRVGLTHHVVLSSEHRCTPGAPMRKWLQHEFLENIDRELTPWLVVHIHRPLYCSESYEDDHAVAKLLRGCLEDLLAANHVDLVFSGHYHAYERTCPVFHGECHEHDGKARAPTHIMIGSGGAELDDAAYFQANWTRARQQEYGHGRLHIFNATHAHFEFVRARDRVVSDAVWIESHHDWDVTDEHRV